MSAKDLGATFVGLLDLAAKEVGGEVLSCTDDFFAEAARMLDPGRGVFLPDEYTDRGKWMDGWESRRKRGPGHDTSVVKLGVRGRVRAIDVDTNHFLGNHPPFASLEVSPDGTRWHEVLPQSPLRPGSQNLFVVDPVDAPTTHVRLHIYPDGGVARLRVWGVAEPEWERADVDDDTRPRWQPGELDLASVRNGALALACSDAFFGPMNNLLAPGRAENMGGGWETRRKRMPGHDWILVRLGAEGTIGFVELDTNHFKGNFAERVALRGIHAPGARITDLVAVNEWAHAAEWTTILETRLQADTRHFFRDELRARGPFTHVKLDVFPDGGVSRLRIWGKRT